MRRGNWGAYVQDNKFRELDELGSRLSLEIDCPVHYPAYDKNIFECKCGVLFPLYLLRGGDWEAIKQKHKEGLKPDDDIPEVPAPNEGCPECGSTLFFQEGCFICPSCGYTKC